MIKNIGRNTVKCTYWLLVIMLTTLSIANACLDDTDQDSAKIIHVNTLMDEKIPSPAIEEIKNAISSSPTTVNNYLGYQLSIDDVNYFITDQFAASRFLPNLEHRTVNVYPGYEPNALWMWYQPHTYYELQYKVFVDTNDQ